MILYSIIKKVAVIFFTITISSLIQAVCVSIREYQAPDGRNIYLLGDVHINSRKLSRHEQEAFIAAAQKRGAVCIVEDMYHYTGNNIQVQRRIREAEKKTSSISPETIGEHSALIRLCDNCINNNVWCFNVEFRQESTFIDDKNAARANLIKCIEEVKRYKYTDKLLREYYGLFNFDEPFFVHDRHFVNKEGYPISLHEITMFECLLVDCRIIHQINLFLTNSKNKKDVFVFTGLMHVENIATLLEQYLKCKCIRFLGVHSPGSFCECCLEDFYGKMDFCCKISQKKRLASINKYKIDIAVFFELDKNQE